MEAADANEGHRPYNLVAELTYRCPLRCIYCSNPLNHREVPDALDGGAWTRAFREAASLGVVHVGLTGGEPTLHPDLPDIVSGAAEAGHYVHLVTAGTTLDGPRLAALHERGLRSVQLSIQDASEAEADDVAGTRCHTKKLAFARQVTDLGLPLTLNAVLHRGNLARVPEIIALARRLGARHLELANAQYHGWALRNRASLLPSAAQLEEAASAVQHARGEAGGPEILFVLPDYFSDRPKPCMGGWGRRILVMTPEGRVLPCHDAGQIAGLEFWRYPERSLEACWESSPGILAFRGEGWMQAPCRTCPERERDFGGCRCQAFRLTGDAAAADPACSLAPGHAIVRDARREATVEPPVPVYRGDARSRNR